MQKRALAAPFADNAEYLELACARVRARIERAIAVAEGKPAEADKHAERAAALAAEPQDDTCRTIAALCRIRGIGETSATVLAREVLYRPFANRKQLASYVGLAPMPYQSGGMDRDRRISRSGNPRARTAIIQLAWLWLRYQPGSALATWFRERVGALQGRTRRIAIVAMARRLLIALWRYVETGMVPDGVAIRAAAETTA